MRHIILLLAAVALSAGGCDAQTPGEAATSASVEAVKGGVLKLDKSTTLGQAFDGYRYFTAKVWTPTTTETGRKLVEAAGTINLAKLTAKDFAAAQAHRLGVPAELITNDPNTANQSATFLREVQQRFKGAQIVFQFVLNLDDTFELKDGKVNLVMADNKVAPLPMTAEETQAVLKDIYEGHFPAHVMAVLLMGSVK